MQLKVKCNSGLLLFSVLLSVIVPKKFRPLFQQIRFKVETNNDDLVTRVFPRFWQAACFYFEFSLVNNDDKLCSDWPLWSLWVWIFDTHLKPALFFSRFFFLFRNKELALFLILKKIKVWYKICWISKSSLTAS